MLKLLSLVLASISSGPDTLRLDSRFDPDLGRTVRSGTYTVLEDRAEPDGRTIDLDLVIVEAEVGHDLKRSDPVVFIAGGPGQAAAELRHLFGHPLGRHRDLLLVSQRGTGRSNGLHCRPADESAQDALESIWDPKRIAACRDALEEQADLTQYTTPIAADDLNELRAALGYEWINLVGGSYGTRFALVYMRRHPDTVRAAVLKGVAPVSFRNPLHHAREAQEALERIFDACAADPGCARAYPNVEAELGAVLARLEAQPAEVTIRDPRTGRPENVRFSRAAFATALRMRMYGDTSTIPWLVHRAFLGDFQPSAEFALANRRGLVDSLALGMLMCVTCNEDVTRIDPAEVDEATRGTFLGATRVQEQMAACALWPKAEVPAGYGEPVTARVPTLVLSGAYDPVTSPRWGEEAARHLPLARHVVVPQTHAIGGPCVDAIIAEFLDHGSADGLDLSCVTDMRLPAFHMDAELPADAP